MGNTDTRTQRGWDYEWHWNSRCGGSTGNGGYDITGIDTGTTGYGTIGTGSTGYGNDTGTTRGYGGTGYGTATADNNNGGWGRLGLLGLNGLVGVFNRSRNPQR